MLRALFDKENIMSRDALLESTDDFIFWRKKVYFFVHIFPRIVFERKQVTKAVHS